MHTKNNLGREGLAQKTSQTFFVNTYFSSAISINNSFFDFQQLAITAYFSMHIICITFLFQQATTKLRGYIALKPTWVCLMHHYRQWLSHYRQPKTQEAIKNKSVTCYILFGNISHAKTYPGILIIYQGASLWSIIDNWLISQSSVSLLHCILKIIEQKNFCLKWDLNLYPSEVNSCCTTTYTLKPKIIAFQSLKNVKENR